MPAPIILRPWRGDDVGAVLEIFTVSSDLSTQYPLPVTTLAEATTCLSQMLAWDTSRRNLAITIDGAAFGNVAITGVEYRHGTGWVSYFSSAAVRGQGLVGRAVTAAANWALTHQPDGLGLDRLELGHRVNNPASGAIARRAGFVQEGLERAKLRYGDERFDVATYGRLLSDPFPEVSGVTLALGD